MLLKAETFEEEIVPFTIKLPNIVTLLLLKVIALKTTLLFANAALEAEYAEFEV